MEKFYFTKKANRFSFRKELFIRVFPILLFVFFSLASNAQTTFASLGADDSASPEYKTVSTNPNIQISNVMDNDGTEMYTNTPATATSFIIKAYGVADFTFEGLTLHRYPLASDTDVDVSSTVVFKDKNGIVLQTMTLNSSKALSTSNTSLASFFDNGTITPIYNVAQIIFDLKTPSPYYSANFNYVNITTSPTPINNAPVATAPSAPTVVEDATNVALNDDIQISDTDVDNQTVTFTITGGTLTLGTTGITFGGSGNGSASFTAAGTLADINDALDAATFTPTTNLSGTNVATISFTTHDGIVASSAASVTFSITGVNDAPTASAPSAPTVSEDATNVALSDDIQVSDIDGDAQTVTFTITGGALTIGTAGTITFGGGGNGTASFTAAGTLTDINAALDAATFTPTANLNGINAGTISFTTHDGTVTSGAASVTFNITAVNDAPTVTAPSAPTVSEDASNVVLADDIQVSDIEGDAQTVTFTITGGTLTIGTAGIITFGGGGNGTASFTAAGTLTDINAALDAATFTPTANLNGSGAGKIEFTSNDGIDNSNTASVTFDIAAVNDEPSLTATGTSPTFTEDGTASDLYSAVTISTFESGQTIAQLVLTVTNVNDGASEILSIDGSDVALTDGNSLTTVTNSMDVSVSVTTNTATVTISKVGGITPALMQSLVDGMTYRNTSNTPNTSTRVVTLTSIQDNGGTANGGYDTAVLSIASTITVVANNDAPTLTSFTGVVETTTQNTEVQITFAELETQGNQADVDGTVDAFIVNAVTTGTLRIGASSATATAYSATTNKTITATNNAYWTPATNAFGELDAFTTTVIDDGGAESTVAVQATVQVDDVTPPTVIITMAKNAFLAGGYSYVYFTFSEEITGILGSTITIPNGGRGPIGTYSYLVKVFDYIVLDNVEDPTNAISIDNTTFFDLAGNQGVGITYSPNFTIDSKIPVVTNVTSTNADGTYGIGDEITITVEFDEAVAVTGTPQLALETGAVDRFANYSSGTGTNTLNFTYTAQSGDESDDLDYKANNSLTLNGGTIKDAAGNNATLTLATPGATNSLGANKALDIQAFPSVTLSVGSSTIVENAGTSTITATLSQISSQDVTVDLSYSGTAISGTDYNAAASSSITIPAGDISANAATGITAIQDLAPEGHETIIVEILSVTKGFEVGDQKQTITILDDDIATVSSVSSSTANGHYKAGNVVNVTVTFSHPVTVTGTPQLVLETGATDRTINYTGGTGTTTLTFSYTVQAGDESADLDYVDINSLSVAGGSIQNSGLDAILTLPIPGATGSLSANKAIVIDTEAPTATISLSDNALKASETATVTITFSEAVTGLTNADLTFSNGTLTPVSSSDGGITWVSTFTPTINVESAINTIILNNLGYYDLAGNAGTGTTSSSNFAIDTKIPVVVNVTSSKANATYGIGETILISVEFDQTVTVTGTPQLGLETGVVDRTIDFVSGNNTNTLVFSYTAGSGDESSDLDYKASGSLIPNGGAIADAAGNNAILTLPAPGLSGSLGANKALVIQAFPMVTLGVGNTSVDENGGTTSITATLSEISTQDVVVSVLYSGPAISGTDYNNTASASITVPAGSSSASATVGIIATDDDIVETNETIIIDITSISKGFDNGAQQQTVTITDDDQAIISIEATTLAAEDATAGVFTISVDKKLSTDLTVDLTLSGTAANGLDMNTMATSVLIPAGSFLVTTPVTLISDAIAEGNETVILTLGTNSGAPVGATVSNSPTDNEATVTITDNDLAVVVSIAATTQAAEDATNGIFTISVDKKLSTALTVILVPFGTAADGVDMSAMATSVVIPAGDFFVTTPVSVISDNLVEGDETVIYVLGTQSGAPSGVSVTNSLTADNATVTIADNDLATLRVTRKVDAYENVSNGGFYVITSKRFDSDVNVGVSVGGTATAGTDYTAIVSPQLFPANTDTLTVTVSQLDDSESEINEYVILNLVTTNNSRVSIAPPPDSTATVTIFDDDQPLVVLSQSATSFSESGGKNAITATLNKVHHTNVVVTLATTGTSTPGNDFSSVATITVPAGTLSATDTLRAIQDQLVESNETIVVDILSVINGVENGTQQVSSTIIDDDEAVLSISSAKNGKEGSSNAVFHVVTDKLIDSGVTVNVATSGTATEGVDYATFGGAITFPAYTDTLDVSVLITNDIDTEDAESVIMILTGTNNADVTIASAPNHRDTVTIIDDDIRQLVIANTVLTTSKIFDGNDIAKVVVGTLTNLIPGDNIVLKAEAHYDNADAGNKKKITIHYTVTGEDSIKYFAPVDSVYLKGLIEQGNLNIFAESKTMRYGDSIPELTIRYEFFDTVGVVSDLDHEITAWVNTDSITGPGTYPIHISGGKDNNYAIFYFEGTLTIEKALLKVTAQDKSITYGEPLPELTYTIEGFLNGDKDSVLTSMPTIAAATGAGENAGVFAIMPSGGSDEFYDFDYQNGKLMVAKAMLTATASDRVSSVGTIPPLTVGYKGFVKGDTSSELDTLPVATTTATKDSPSGEYPISVSGGYDNNYNFTYIGGELTLASKANPTITWNTPSDIVYGELLGDKQLNATCNAYGTLVYEPAAGTLLGAGDMQELKVTFIPKDTINVNKASATVHIDVERATITVTANDKTITYGEILPVLSFSYSAFMNGENASVLDKRPSASTMVGVTDAGTYPIVLFGGEDDNYKFEYINGELTIEKAKLTVDVKDCEMFEGDALPVFELVYSGFITGESATVLDTLPKATTQVTTESAPGIYEVIAAGGKDNNYSFVYEKGNLTVKAKQHPVVTWANPSDITYGTVLGATQLNAKANIAGTFTYTPSTGTVLAAGKSQLLIARFTPTDIANYAVVTDTALINVSKAPLTVTADDAEMKAGETMPEFTMSYAGFVNGDDKSDIDKQPVATSTASSTSEKGEYAITVSGGEDNNYSFAYANGTLTIKSGDAVKVIEAMSLSVYPNPFTDQVSITSDYKGVGSYQLSDITGKVIEQGNIANGTGNLKLSHIRSGVYLLQVKMGEGCKSFRLIKR